MQKNIGEYGFAFLTVMTDLDGNPSKVYVKMIADRQPAVSAAPYKTVT